MIAFTSVFHPSDFTTGDEAAFAHALKIALSVRGKLSLLHVGGPDEDAHWSDFPGVRETLSRWGLAPAGADREAVTALGLDVHKVLRTARDVMEGILGYAYENQPDLIVLATHQRAGLARLLHKAMAEPIARQSQSITLFVPRRIMGFVSAETGLVRLRNIVIPVAQSPRPQRAIEAAIALGAALGAGPAHLSLIYVGEDSDMPECHVSPPAGWTFEQSAWKGSVVEHILAVAEDRNADLIAMATEGRRGFLDALRGSTTERVLQGARCPVLAVPAG